MIAAMEDDALEMGGLTVQITTRNDGDADFAVYLVR